jgi:Tol biopolymer transport system component
MCTRLDLGAQEANTRSAVSAVARSRRKWLVLVVGGAGVALVAAAFVGATGGWVGTDPARATRSKLIATNGPNWDAAISADGRFIAFTSESILVTPFPRGVFVRDRRAGKTERADVSSSGEQGSSQAESPVLSADGRLVVFDSSASNLVAGDTNSDWDVFVRDRQKGTTERVNEMSGGAEADGEGNVFRPAISADGRFVALSTQAPNLVTDDTNRACDVFVHDRLAGATERVSVSSHGAQGNGWSDSPALSADGRFVVFASDASNLVPGDTNGQRDVFVRDRVSGTTDRVSMSTSGEQANDRAWAYPSGENPAVSADGQIVVFASYASNLVHGDTNGKLDVFARDRRTGSTTRVSVSSAGRQGNFGSGIQVALSADGGFVAFTSWATNLVAHDSNGRTVDLFVHDRKTGTTTLVDLSSRGAEGGPVGFPAISADGRFVAFVTHVPLVAGDTDKQSDVFVRDRRKGTTTLVSVGARP